MNELYQFLAMLDRAGIFYMTHIDKYNRTVVEFDNEDSGAKLTFNEAGLLIEAKTVSYGCW